VIFVFHTHRWLGLVECELVDACLLLPRSPLTFRFYAAKESALAIHSDLEPPFSRLRYSNSPDSFSRGFGEIQCKYQTFLDFFSSLDSDRPLLSITTPGVPTQPVTRRPQILGGLLDLWGYYTCFPSQNNRSCDMIFDVLTRVFISQLATLTPTRLLVLAISTSRAPSLSSLSTCKARRS
jgi:hypothetical protein